MQFYQKIEFIERCLASIWLVKLCCMCQPYNLRKSHICAKSWLFAVIGLTRTTFYLSSYLTLVSFYAPLWNWLPKRKGNLMRTLNGPDCTWNAPLLILEVLKDKAIDFRSTGLLVHVTNNQWYSTIIYMIIFSKPFSEGKKKNHFELLA